MSIQKYEVQELSLTARMCVIFSILMCDWLYTVGVMPHKEGYSTKYIILQISNAAQNFSVHYLVLFSISSLMADLKMHRILLILTYV